MRRIALLVNGPGELWGWARPLSRTLADCGFSVTLWLLPCQFSSGREAVVARRLDVSEIVGPFSAPRMSIEIRKTRVDAVIQLGGDLFFGRIMASASRSPLLCYTYGQKKGLNRCDVVMTAFSRMQKSIEAAGVSVERVGDLVSDALKMDEGPIPWRSDGGFRLVLFPGSRGAIRRKALPWLRSMIKVLREREAALQVTTLLSPFSCEEEIADWRDADLFPVTTETGAVLRGADMALTQPGTNTLELMHRGIPAVVSLPFDFLREVPVSGLKGVIFKMPWLGSSLKEVLLRHASRRAGYLSWPNRLAGREIMREIVGDISPGEMAMILSELMKDRAYLEEQRRELSLLGSKGRENASARICNVVEEILG